jgi:hypothetical protein
MALEAIADTGRENLELVKQERAEREFLFNQLRDQGMKVAPGVPTLAKPTNDVSAPARQPGDGPHRPPRRKH